MNLYDLVAVEIDAFEGEAHSRLDLGHVCLKVAQLHLYLMELYVLLLNLRVHFGKQAYLVTLRGRP